MKLADVNIDVREIYDEIIQRLRAQSSFTSVYEGETIRFVAELLAGLAAQMNYRISTSVMNAYLPTAFSRSGVWNLALSTGGVPPHRKRSARLVGDVATASTLDVIPPFSLWTGRGLDWYNREAVAINAGVAMNVRLNQGSPRRDRFANARNVPYFRVLIGENFAVDDPLRDSDAAMIVRGNNVVWREIRDSLINADPDENDIWTSRSTADGRVAISFGNNILGNIPETVEVDYALTRGAEGNSTTIGDEIALVSDVAGNRFPELAAAAANLVVTEAATGGENEESPEDIRLTAPRLTAANRRAVRQADYQVALETYPQVRFASVWGEREEEAETGFADVRNMNTAFLSLLKDGVGSGAVDILPALRNRALVPGEVIPDSHLIPVRGRYEVSELALVKGSVYVDFDVNLDRRYRLTGPGTRVVAPTTPAGTDNFFGERQPRANCWETWAAKDADGNFAPWNRYVGSLVSGESAGSHGYRDGIFGTLGPTVRNTLPLADAAFTRFFVSASLIDLEFVDGENARHGDGWTFVIASPRSDFPAPIRLSLSSASSYGTGSHGGNPLHIYTWSDIEGASGFAYAQWQEILAAGQEVQYRLEGPGWSRPTFGNGFCYLTDGPFRLEDQSGQGVLAADGVGIGEQSAIVSLGFVESTSVSDEISRFVITFDEPFEFRGIRFRWRNSSRIASRVRLLTGTQDNGSDSTIAVNDVYLPDHGPGQWTDWIGLGEPRTGVRYLAIATLSQSIDGSFSSAEWQILDGSAETNAAIETDGDGEYATTAGATGLPVNTVRLDAQRFFVDELNGATIRYIGNNFAAAENDEIETYVNDLKNFTTRLARRDPIARMIDVNVEVNYSSDAPPLQIESAVRAALVAYFASREQGPGRLLALSDLYQVVTDVENVDHCRILLPTADLPATRNRFFALRDVTISVQPSTRPA